MSPEFQTAALRAAATLSLLLAIAGCSIFKTNEEAQAAINQRVVGMQVGDFFDRYGFLEGPPCAARRFHRVRLDLGDRTYPQRWPSTASTIAPAR